MSNRSHKPTTGSTCRLYLGERGPLLICSFAKFRDHRVNIWLAFQSVEPPNHTDEHVAGLPQSGDLLLSLN